MSLTSYRAAPPRANRFVDPPGRRRGCYVAIVPGNGKGAAGENCGSLQVLRFGRPPHPPALKRERSLIKSGAGSLPFGVLRGEVTSAPSESAAAGPWLIASKAAPHIAIDRRLRRLDGSYGATNRLRRRLQAPRARPWDCAASASGRHARPGPAQLALAPNPAGCRRGF